MSLRDIFNAILDFNLLYIIYILIGVCIIGLFLNVIKKVKTTIKKNELLEQINSKLFRLDKHFNPHFETRDD